PAPGGIHPPRRDSRQEDDWLMGRRCLSGGGVMTGAPSGGRVGGVGGGDVRVRGGGSKITVGQTTLLTSLKATSVAVIDRAPSCTLHYLLFFEGRHYLSRLM